MMADYTSVLENGAAVDAELIKVRDSNLNPAHKITRGATVVVAASDSSAKSKAQADYVCDGVADDVEIQAALDSLPSTGGEIHLLDGTYQLAATVTRAIDNIMISGCGFSTYLAYNNLARIISCGTQQYWAFDNFRTDYGGIDYTGGTKWTLKNIWRNSSASAPEYIDNFSDEHMSGGRPGSLRQIISNHRLVNTLENCQTEDWVMTGGESLTYDTSVFCYGSKSVKLVTVADEGATVCNAVRTATYPDLTNCTFSMTVRTPDPTKISLIYLDINTGAGSWQHFGYFGSSAIQTVADEWFEITYNSLDVVGTPDYSNVTKIRVRVKPIANQSATLYIGRIKFTKKVLAPKGIVTFSFDDGFDSCPNIAKPIMDTYGYKGVHGVIAAEVGTAELASAKFLQNSGWDVVSHSYNHSPTLSLSDPEWEYMVTKKWLADNGFNGADMVLLTGGLHNAKLVKLAKMNMSFTRSSMTGYNSLPEIGNLQTARTIRVSTPIATVKTWIDKAKAEGLWLVLMFHEIVAANATGYQITTADFTEIVTYCNSTGVDVLTFSDVEKIIRNPVITNNGTGTIANSTTSVNIRHGFHKEPTSIQITPTSSLGSAASLWVSSKDTGTGNLFTVSVNADPGQDVTFEWVATL